MITVTVDQVRAASRLLRARKALNDAMNNCEEHGIEVRGLRPEVLNGQTHEEAVHNVADLHLKLCNLEDTLGDLQHLAAGEKINYLDIALRESLHTGCKAVRDRYNVTVAFAYPLVKAWRRANGFPENATSLEVIQDLVRG